VTSSEDGRPDAAGKNNLSILKMDVRFSYVAKNWKHLAKGETADGAVSPSSFVGEEVKVY